ncbi:hypothetical protein ACH4G3_05260 [Streptomyces afghaniensis]|uniref:hypothetical protein n=1 Tax=Streptomyces afghaniensis TaxID=66865 RepID=UPI0037A6A530
MRHGPIHVATHLPATVDSARSALADRIRPDTPGRERRLRERRPRFAQPGHPVRSSWLQPRVLKTHFGVMPRPVAMWGTRVSSP